MVSLKINLNRFENSINKTPQKFSYIYEHKDYYVFCFDDIFVSGYFLEFLYKYFNGDISTKVIISIEDDKIIVYFSKKYCIYTI